MAKRFSRREVIGGAGVLAAAGAATALGGCSSSGRSKSASTVAAAGAAEAIVPFGGLHQAGIATPPQQHLIFAAFDLVEADRVALMTLFEQWTEAAIALTAGRPVGAAAPASALSPPVDTGEALELGPSNLTVTVGVGRSVFVDGNGRDRLGLANKLPPALVPIPMFAGDVLDPTRSDGDISLQCCADDPTVAFHAFHNLARLARGTASLRWVQRGAGQASTTAERPTPRNFQGFKDGTNNVDVRDPEVMNTHVWVHGADGAPWLQGGSYVVTRRIRMRLEHWDRSSLGDQEQTIGRSKVSGAPLGGRAEHDPPNLDAKNNDGDEVIPLDAHIRIAAPSENNGTRLLRRGYNYDDGAIATTGEMDAGLFFVAYQRDPRKQFIPLQQRLASLDALNEYIVHTSSALFATLPGADDDKPLGATLLK